MVLKVDPDELQDVAKIMEKDSQRYKKEIGNMEASLEKIANNWKGIDADSFVINFRNFLKKMKGIPATMDTLSEVCNKANEGYVSRDEEFARELKEGAFNNE